jgi:thiosulfate dehydrogenase
MTFARPWLFAPSLLLCSLIAFWPAMATETQRGDEIAHQGTATGAPPCLGCHGAAGEGQAATGYPRLAGLDAGYLANQLRAFRAGTRANAVMGAVLKSLTDQEIADVSAYYASLPAPPLDSPAPAPGQRAMAERLARTGDWAGRRLPACNQCHGPEGQGIGSFFPGIAGQHANYLQAQLQAWQAGERDPGPLGLMAAVARRLSAEDIAALAADYSARPARPAIPAQWLMLDSAASTVNSEPVHRGEVPHFGRVPQGRDAPVGADKFAPPSRDARPTGPLGDSVRLGEALFNETSTHPLSAPLVGNRLSCRHCHLDAGRLADSAPLWAAWVAYPDYLHKDRRVDTFGERVQNCFVYSLNAQDSQAGGPPAVGSPVLDALETYSYWLATGAPTGDRQMPGRGYPHLKPPSAGFDIERGRIVYQQTCALCHGEQGTGVSDANGRVLFPPLWGAAAYNQGAGMHRIAVAAAFIHANMPLGRPASLSEQQAWDVAAFIHHQEHPRDPRSHKPQ